jgi:hypothetical protein
MMRRVLPFLASAVFLFACAAPRTTVKTDDQSGTIRFKVQPGSALVTVDGRSMGKAREFDGSAAVLKLPPGTHAVRLTADGYEDYAANVYLSDTEELIEIKMREKK